MDDRSHEIPLRPSNDPKHLINKAMREGYLVYIKYRDTNGQESTRKIEPLEWVEDYKFRAYCHLRDDERHFVISGIREISLLAKSDGSTAPPTPAQRSLSKLDQWRAAQPSSTERSNIVTQKRVPEFRVDQLFSQVTNAVQWQQLISYYRECLNREYLQDYIIDQRDEDNYYFFPTDEDRILRFLASGSTFSFPVEFDNHPVEIAEFIVNPTKQERQLCVGYPVLLTPEGKIAPLFFTSCEVEDQQNTLVLHPDEYELSYAILHSLDLDKEDFAVIVAELGQFEFEDLARRIKALQEALVEKLGEMLGDPIPRREANRSRMRDSVNQITLLTTPCLFWVSKNNITQALIEELEDLSKRAWTSMPQSLVQLLNAATPGEYPAIVPLARDNKVFVTPVNDDQRRACQSASVVPITVVTGPPGTGKSQLVLNIIANAVIEGKSVLFASRNNRAVDVVFNRMRSDMRFDGMIRTGNRAMRKEAADAMLRALSKVATKHQKPETTLLHDRYRQAKVLLAKKLNELDQIQRLQISLMKKTQQFHETLDELPQGLASLCQNASASVGQDTIDLGKQYASTLLRAYQIMGQRKETIESVLQAHITDNKHQHPLICDIEHFEMEWGRFGEGVRSADYFSTMESLQRHIDFWIHLLDAADTRILIQKTTVKAETLEQKLSELLRSLPGDLQLMVEDEARTMTEEKLNNLRGKITSLDKLVSNARRPSVSNWFGFRRGPQISAIAAAFEPLLIELEQPPFHELPDLDELRELIETLKTYIQAIVGRRLLAIEHHNLQRAKAKFAGEEALLDERTRNDLARLKIQHVQSNELRKVLVRLGEEISKVLFQRNSAIEAFQTHMRENPSLGNLWTQFQNEVGKEEYVGWTLNSEMGINVLQHFTSQWLSTLNAIELRTVIHQIEAHIESMGGEQRAQAGVEDAQQQANDMATQILNVTWLQNFDNLHSDSIQRVTDYASLMQEVFDNYDRQKYSSMMSIQETFADEIIAAFPVWATTNLSVNRNLPLRAELFDYVIIDEASQCDIPSALPLIYRAKQVVIIGDAMQLRHIATLIEDSHQLLAAEYNVATEAYSYTRHSLFDLASRSVGHNPGILMLREHYRSHERIISFSNQAFYGGNLIIKTNMANRNIPANIIDNACGIFWVDVPGETIHPSGGSAKNLHEITVIERILPVLAEGLRRVGWDGSLGVVTPYREQKNVIQGWVDDHSMRNITVGTAHTFQGDEREILLFSTVLAPGISAGSLGWLKTTVNLLNVAITRARTSLIIIGDFNFCMSLPENNPYRNLAEYVRAKPNTVLESWEELPLVSALR